MASHLISTSESAVPSKWLLHKALSDLERKARATRAILEGDTDDFINGKSEKTIYTGNVEILGLLEQITRSYTMLARDNNRLKTKFIHHENLSNEKEPSNNSDPESDSSLVSGVEDVELENFDIGLPCKPIDEIGPFTGLKSSSKWEIEEEVWSWDEMTARVTELVEESAKKQEELVRRNEEKREIIRELRTEVNRLKAENKALLDCLVGSRACSEGTHRGNNRLPKTSSLKELVWNKIFRRGS